MTRDEIRIARVNAGYSIRGLAKHLKMPEQSIRAFEAGGGISLENAKKLADFYGTTVIGIYPEALEKAA